jgi:5-(carboxyamino)imidazole ribonucleotide synthase
MVNVLGGDLEDLYPAYLHCMARDPAMKFHMYGKAVKPGRKVGHVTALGRSGTAATGDVNDSSLQDLLERTRHAAAYLRGDINE